MSTNVIQKTNMLQKIEAAAPAQVANLPEVAEKFKNIYTVMNGGDTARAAVKYEAENSLRL